MPETAGTSTQKLIAALWQRNQPQVLDRLALLDRAAAAVATGKLTPFLRDEAAGIAHKLAGSLGMFGFHEGTRVARELELRLECSTPDATAIILLTAELRRALNATS